MCRCWLCEQKRTTLKPPGQYQIDEQTTIPDIRVTYTYNVEPSYQYVSNTIREGWLCPKCGIVNAPWMPYCWMCYLRKEKEESRE